MKKFAGKGKKAPVKEVVEEVESASDAEEEQSDVADDEEAEEEVDGEESESDDELELAQESDDSEDDDDEEVGDDEDVAPEEAEKPAFDKPKTSLDNIIEKIESRKGKQLFVRFPKKITKDEGELLAELKKYSAGIVKVHRPRQAYARFCTVDFENDEERQKGLKELKAVKFDDNKKLVIEFPKIDEKNYVSELADKRQKQKDKKKAKHALRKLAKIQSKTFTSTLVVSNVPKTSTVADIKELFPNCIDARVTYPKGDQTTATATVSLPTPQDATKYRNAKLTLDENQLRIKFGGLAKKGKGKEKVKGAAKRKLLEGGDESAAAPVPAKKQKPEKKAAPKPKPQKAPAPAKATAPAPAKATAPAPAKATAPAPAKAPSKPNKPNNKNGPKKVDSKPQPQKNGAKAPSKPNKPNNKNGPKKAKPQKN